MYSRQLEQLARQRTSELNASRARRTVPAEPQRQQIKTRAGWALVQIGLRLAADGR